MTPAAFRAKWLKVTLNECEACRQPSLDPVSLEMRKRRVAASVTKATNFVRVQP